METNTLKFRALHADEIDVRVQSVSKNGDKVILLLYKDARVDMALLDEVVTPMRWQREHQLINGNLYCKVSIWDEQTTQWISKSDVGTESNTEATKGEASDSFKRACFNWGIGRELYTSPFISIPIAENERYGEQGKYKASPYLKFSVKHIGYTEQDGRRTISELEIIDNKGATRYTFGMKATAQAQAQGQKKAPVTQTASAPQPSAPTPEDDNLIVALQEVKEAKTVDDLADIKKRWRESLGINNQFVNALMQRYNAIINS